MERKTYSKPLMVSEKFEPQNFCAPWDGSITITMPNDYRSFLRVDLDDDDWYDADNGVSSMEFGGNCLSWSSLPVTLKANQFVIENHNVWRQKDTFDQSHSYSSESFTTGNYTLVTTQVIHSAYGKYYVVSMDGTGTSNTGYVVTNSKS